jgi:hypothetical protein
MTALATLLAAASLGLGLGLAREPYVGVACRAPNTTACGRVGVAVWLARRHAVRVDATLAGAHVRLQPPPEVGAFWQGFVRLRLGLPASWVGSPPRRLTLRLRIAYGDGVRVGSMRVQLSPGWG